MELNWLSYRLRLVYKLSRDYLLEVTCEQLPQLTLKIKHALRKKTWNSSKYKIRGICCSTDSDLKSPELCCKQAESGMLPPAGTEDKHISPARFGQIHCACKHTNAISKMVELI